MKVKPSQRETKITPEHNNNCLWFLCVCVCVCECYSLLFGHVCLSVSLWACTCLRDCLCRRLSVCVCLFISACVSACWCQSLSLSLFLSLSVKPFDKNSKFLPMRVNPLNIAGSCSLWVTAVAAVKRPRATLKSLRHVCAGLSLALLAAHQLALLQLAKRLIKTSALGPALPVNCIGTPVTPTPPLVFQ